MKTMVRVLMSLVLVTAAGCGKKEGEGDKASASGGPAPVAKQRGGVDQANCDKVANKLSIARNKTLALGGKLPKFAAGVADACRANAWPEAVRGCLVSAAGDDAAKACVEGADTKDAIVADINKALTDAGLTTTW